MRRCSHKGRRCDPATWPLPDRRRLTIAYNCQRSPIDDRRAAQQPDGGNVVKIIYTGKTMIKRTVGAVLLLTFIAFNAYAAGKVNLHSKNAEVFDTHPHWDYYLTSSHPTGRLESVESYHLKPAIELIAANKLESAYDEVAFLLVWFPNHPKALNLLTHITTRAQQPQVAERHFRDAFTLYPNRPQTHMLYGIYQSKLKAQDKAIESYKRALEIDPNYAEAHYNLGLAYYHTKKYDLANRHAQTAYAAGYPLPGLERLLKEKKAWNTAAKAAPASVSATPDSDERASKVAEPASQTN